MHPSAPLPPSDCTSGLPLAVAPTAEPTPPSTARMSARLTAQPLFPPKGADPEARRRWLASSPWPEVVFASAV